LRQRRRLIAIHQLLATSFRAGAVAAEFVPAADCLGHEGVWRLQNGSAFLLELFLARFHHLVVGRFLNAVRDELLAEVLFVFYARRAMAAR
jgi:hypothetical protein